MFKRRLKSFLVSRYPWALAAGAVLACAFPNIGLAGLAWIAPALILLPAAGRSPKMTFRLGYAAGLAHYLISLSWLLRIPVIGAPILGWAALSAFMALYPGVWVWLTWRQFPGRLGEGGPPANLAELAKRFLTTSWSQRFMWCLFSAALWVALEMMITRFLGGFPWNLLGASQYRMVPLIQIAAYTGVYGVAFLIVWFAVSLLCGALAIIGRPALRSAWAAEAILPLTVVAFTYASGYWQVMRPTPPGPELKLALIQPSIPQTVIWDAHSSSNRMQQLLDLSRAALTNHPDVLIWPEGVVPGVPRYQPDLSAALSDLARSNHLWLIIGADDAKLPPNATSWEDGEYYNSSFLLAPDGGFDAVYKKRQLVIFGEYVPLVRWLPFLKYLTPIQGGFTPGTGPVPFKLNEPKANLSVLICFEDIFPDFAREYAASDTDFLINLTNDGWFGEGAAQWQQAACAIFRAVENGLPLVRCANNGLTGWADAHGRLRNHLETPEHGIYGPGFLIVRVPLLDPANPRVETYYHRYGDRFGWLCVAFAAFPILRTLRRRKSTAPPAP